MNGRNQLPAVTVEPLERPAPPHAWIWPLAAALLLLVGLASAWWLTRCTLPAALVNFRYAENLAAGQGFGFEPHDQVFGTDSPLHALLLALVAGLAGPEHVAIAGTWVGILCALAGALAVYAMLRTARVGAAWSAAAMLLTGLHPALLAPTIGGTATPLCVALMAFSLLALVRGRWITAGVLAALLPAAHPAGVLWAVLVLLVIIGASGRGALAAIIVFASVLAVQVGCALAYFGDWVPGPLLAERAWSAQGGAVAWAGVLRWYGAWLLDHLWLPRSHGWWMIRWQAWGWVVLLLLGVLGIARRPRGVHGLIILAVMPMGYGVVAWLGVDLRSPGSAAPLTWCAVLLGLIGLAELWTVGRLYWREFALPAWGLGAVGALVLAVIAVGLVNRDVVACRHLVALRESDMTAGQTVGEWLAVNAEPGDRVAVDGVGYAVYRAKRPVLDLSGALSPQIAELVDCHDSFGAVMTTVLADATPAYVVLFSDAVRENRRRGGGELFATHAQAWYFRAHYVPVLETGEPMPQGLAEGGEGLTIYRRRSWAGAAH